MIAGAAVVISLDLGLVLLKVIHVSITQEQLLPLLLLNILIIISSNNRNNKPVRFLLLAVAQAVSAYISRGALKALSPTHTPLLVVP